MSDKYVFKIFEMCGSIGEYQVRSHKYHTCMMEKGHEGPHSCSICKITWEPVHAKTS